MLKEERKKLGGYFSLWGLVRGRGLGVFMHRGHMGEIESGERWESIRLKEKREFYLKREKHFEWGIYCEFEKGREREV